MRFAVLGDGDRDGRNLLRTESRDRLRLREARFFQVQAQIQTQNWRGARYLFKCHSECNEESFNSKCMMFFEKIKAYFIRMNFEQISSRPKGEIFLVEQLYFY